MPERTDHTILQYIIGDWCSLLCCRSTTPASVLQSTWSPSYPQSQCWTSTWSQVSWEWWSWSGQFLWFCQSCVSGWSTRSQQITQGVSVQLLQPQYVSTSTTHVKTSPTSPLKWPHLITPSVQLTWSHWPPDDILWHDAWFSVTSSWSSCSTSWRSVSLW